MQQEDRIAEIVDNTLVEILKLVKLSERNGYLKISEFRGMLKQIRGNLRSDPGLYRRLVLDNVDDPSQENATSVTFFKSPEGRAETDV